jgi:hypothetical protein
MNLHEIELLLEKYFEGDTSLAEEQKLREFFASGNVPERWKNLEGYFIYLTHEQDQQINDPGFDDKVMSQVKEDRLARLTDLRRPWIYWISGIAASVLILVAIFVKFDPISRRVEDTYKDPEVAFNEAKKILLYVSEKFNQGTRNLEPIGTLDAGLSELKPVGAYSKVINEVKRLNEVEKVEKMITNN